MTKNLNEEAKNKGGGRIEDSEENSIRWNIQSVIFSPWATVGQPESLQSLRVGPREAKHDKRLSRTFCLGPVHERCPIRWHITKDAHCLDWCRPGTKEQSWQAERGLHSRSASSLHSTYELWGPKWETWLLFNSTPACGLDESTKGSLGVHSSITWCYRPQIPNTKTIRYWLRFSGFVCCFLLWLKAFPPLRCWAKP